jgi:hypothetical protein
LVRRFFRLRPPINTFLYLFQNCVRAYQCSIDINFMRYFLWM